MTETISEKVGLHKVIDGTNKRTVKVPVTVETENREYVGDLQALNALPFPTTVARSCGDGDHPSPFYDDPLVRTVPPTAIVRRSLTWKEAVKAVFSKTIDRPLVAIEVELITAEQASEFEDSFV